MKKYWIAIFVVLILGVTISVAGDQDSNEVNIDGDMGPNPWQESFTTAVVLTPVETSSDESQMTTPVGTSSEEQQSTTTVGPSYETESTANSIGAEQKTTANIITTDKATPKVTKNVKVGKTKVKKATKKINSKKVALKLKRIKGAQKYQIQIAKNKKFKKILVKKTVKKIKVKISSKKIKNKKKLYVRARAIKIISGKKYNGNWSKAKKIKIKK